MNREKFIEELSQKIINLSKYQAFPCKVAIDGVDASGKTTLADELFTKLKNFNKEIIRASIDGFHNPRIIRYERGKDSPEGYYHNSFNYKALVNELLKPLSEGGNLKYRTTVFNFLEDKEVSSFYSKANRNSILLMDGVFLLRPELVRYWDLKIFLDVDFKITLERAVKRDGYLLGEEEDIRERYNKRYIPGQKIYFEEAKPLESADVIIDNRDFLNPLINCKINALF